MKRSLIPVITIAAAAFAAIAYAQTPPTMIGDSEKGKVLTDAKGMTLYIYDKDTAGKSVCNGKCAVNWPPLMAAGDAMASGDYSIVTRDDGNKQWAYKGMPLYGWIKDTKAGDITGDDVGGVWHLATP